MALLSEGRNAWIIGELAMFYAEPAMFRCLLNWKKATTCFSVLPMQRLNSSWYRVISLKDPRTIIDQLPLLEKVICSTSNLPAGEGDRSAKYRPRRAWLETHTLEEFLSVGRSLPTTIMQTITYTSGNHGRSERGYPHPPELHGQRRTVALRWSR